MATNIQRDIIPTLDELQKHAEIMPQINPSAVLLMLEVMQASAQIQHYIFDILADKYQISEGKLRVMIILHQQKKGIAPSYLAEKAKVTRATISAMLHRMERDGIVSLTPSPTDARRKYVNLTDKGYELIGTVLPKHYLRITNLMHNLTSSEQEQLIYLLRKITMK